MTYFIFVGSKITVDGDSRHEIKNFAPWKEKKECNRMGKTGELFKKMRDTKGTFHAKMGSIKDRNGRDLTEG